MDPERIYNATHVVCLYCTRTDLTQQKVCYVLDLMCGENGLSERETLSNSRICFVCFISGHINQSCM